MAFVIGGVLTPTPDPFNQSLMAAPLILFYEIGILLAGVMARRRQARMAALAAQDVSTG
jgi:sec-independent protein translocase protein TatC